MNLTHSIPAARLLEYVSIVSEEIFFAFDLSNHQIIHLTPAFKRLWNLNVDVVKNNLQTVLDTVHEDDKTIAAQAYNDLLTHKKRITVEFRIQTPDNQQKWIKLTACIFNNEVGANQLIVGIAKDCTADKEYSENLYDFLNRKDALLTVLSHDLAAPLNNIYMSAKFINEEVASTKNETIIQLLEVIEETSRNGINLIHSFFNKEFMNMSEIVLIKHRTDLAERLREIVSMYHRAKHITKINYRLVTSSDSIYVDIDVIKFTQAIQNLITNAQKFTPDGGNITIAVEEQDAEVVIKIEDDGIGIPAELQPFLFEKYSKAKRAGLRGEPTIGLGLFIIKNIVEWHGGRVWYQPAPVRGSAFFIAIPKNATS